MSYDGRAIANFVLDYSEQSGISITNLSLQKIIYFCHVWTLIEQNQPLVKQSFEAWKHGPVLPYLYQEFKSFGALNITSRAQRINKFSGKNEVVPYSFNEELHALLQQVVNFYSRLSSGMLVKLTHIENGPWHKIWEHQGSIKPGMRIDNHEIATFYAKIPKPVTLQ